MDRNLGATEAALSLKGRGLFYQWGRKDPFPGKKEGTAGYAALSSFNYASAGVSIVQSIQNPVTFYYCDHNNYDWLSPYKYNLWNASDTKTIYDPCPEGWRVPANGSSLSSPWKGVSASSWTEGSDTGGANWGTNALYPAAGHRNYRGSSINDKGSYGYYWSASPYNNTSNGASSLYFNFGGGIDWSDFAYRAHGFSVRCARE